MAEIVNNMVVQSLWIGSELSKVEQLCIRSFIDHGHHFHLYVYQEVAGVPPGTTLLDARCVLPEEAIFSYPDGWGKGSFAGFADHFRVELIHQLGGWWVDMDVVCLRPFELGQNTVICSSFEGEHGVLVNANIFKMPAGNRLTGECLNRLHQIDIKNAYFGEAGPILFQHVVRDLNLEKQVVPYHFFNPIYWRYTNELILGIQSLGDRLKESIRPFLRADTMQGRRVLHDSYAVHLWNEVWRQGNLDKNGHYRPSSLFEKLKRKHGVK